MVKIPKHVEDLKPYRAGKPIDELRREKNLDKIVKLASNENPLGSSPKAVQAILSSLDEIHRYTDPLNHKMTVAFSAKLKIQPEHIIFGHGTDSLLVDIINAFSVQGDELLTSSGTFIGIFVNVKKLGRSLKTVPMKNYGYDLEAIQKAITDKTKIIYLANPNNPTGSMITIEEFKSFMDFVPDNILVILDEAYYAYAEEFSEYPDGLRYNYDNMVVTRTLSKIYGLGGMRIGFAVGPRRLIEALKKVRLPFEPNILSQEAAIAALDDKEFIEATVKLNRSQINKMVACFEKLDIEYVKPFGNFVMLVLNSEKTAERFFETCLNKGLIVRPVAAFGVPNGIRINSGTAEETDFALKIIEEIYPQIIKQNDEEKINETTVL